MFLLLIGPASFFMAGSVAGGSGETGNDKDVDIVQAVDCLGLGNDRGDA